MTNIAKDNRKGLFAPIDLTHGSCWKTILRFSIPVILSCLFQQVYTISDAAIIGQTLSSGQVAGVNDSSPIIYIFLQFAFGISTGFSVITSCAVGSSDKEGTRKAFAVQILLCFYVTIFLTALSVVLLNPLLFALNITPNDTEVYEAARTYCLVIFAGIGAQLYYNFICSFLRSLGDSVTPLVFLVFSTILNVGLDILFIKAFNWGVFGAAIATVIAQLLSTIGSFVYALARYKEIRPKKEDFRLTFSEAKRHLRQGIPLGLQFSVLSIGLIVMQSGVVKFDMSNGYIISASAQNGYGAACKLLNVLCTPVNALGIAMTSFAAQNLGANDYDRIKKGTLQSIIIMVIISVICILIAFLCTINNAYLRLFLSYDKITNDTIKYGNTYIIVAFTTFVFLGFIFVVRNCVQGIEQPKFVLSAGAAELVARVLVCLILPSIFAGGAVSASSPISAYIALCAADPCAWIASDLVLSIPFLKNIMKKNYDYLKIKKL